MKWHGNPSRGPVGTPTETFTIFLPVVVTSGSVDSPPPAAETLWNSVENAEWRNGSLVRFVTDTCTTAFDISASSAYWEFNITAKSTTWAEQLRSTSPTITGDEVLIGMAYQVASAQSFPGIQDPTGGSVRFNLINTKAPPASTYCYYLNSGSVLAAIQAANDFGTYDAESSVNLDAGYNLATYARIGAGGTPPGSGYLYVNKIQWLVQTV